jgi:hypothetical protein
VEKKNANSSLDPVERRAGDGLCGQGHEHDYDASIDYPVHPPCTQYNESAYDCGPNYSE